MRIPRALPLLLLPLLLAGSPVPSPLPDASATTRGAVSTGAQTFAGAKTFNAIISAPAGINAYNGSITVGFAGVGVGASSEPLSLAGGWGIASGTPAVQINGATIQSAAGDVVVAFHNGQYGVNGNPAARVTALGRVDQYGTDSSGTPGAATINKGSGISAIASGATTVVITNSLATTTSRVMVTWHGDHGAARWWVTRAAGSFTVTLSAAATANTSFSWEVASLL